MGCENAVEMRLSGNPHYADHEFYPWHFKCRCFEVNVFGERDHCHRRYFLFRTPPRTAVRRFSVRRFSVRRFSVRRFSVRRFSVRRFSVRRFSVRRFSVRRFSVRRFSVHGFQANACEGWVDSSNEVLGLATVGWAHAAVDLASVAVDLASVAVDLASIAVDLASIAVDLASVDYEAETFEGFAFVLALVVQVIVLLGSWHEAFALAFHWLVLGFL
jgi:hypothetical protein